MPTTPPPAPPTATPGMTSDQRLQQLQQSGWTGDWVVNGQLQHMTNGQFGAPATPASPATTPPTGAPPQQNGDPTQMPGYLGNVGMNIGPQGMSPWANWMGSGGVNPAGWQGLGGGPNTDFFSTFQNYLNGGANPTQVDPTSASSLFGAAQPYMDTAYQQSMRELQPQMDQQNAAFQQQMQNQGITPGSAAYQQAQQTLSQQQNDATSQARAQAQQQGLAAQAQGFGQGLSQSQLASQLAGQLLGANTSFANQQLGGNASIMNQLLGGNSGIAQQLIGGNATMNAAGQAANASRANSMNNYRLGEDQLAQSGQQADFGNLMQLLGLGSGVTSYNNGLMDQSQRNAQSFLGYLPNGGSGAIDAQSPYNNQYTGNMNNWNYQNQQANAQNSALMSMAMMAFLCDRNLKEPIESFKAHATEIVRSLPVDLWRYKNQPDIHVGTYAQDFNKAAGLPDQPFIRIIDMMGVLTRAVQELIEKTDRIESRLQIAGA